VGKSILELLTTAGPSSAEATGDQETFGVTHYLHSPYADIPTHVLRTHPPFQELQLDDPLSGSQKATLP